MTKETLKLALEALEEQIRMANGWQSPSEAKVHTAIKAALAQQNDHSEQHLDMVKAQPAQEPVKLVSYNCKCGRTMNFESVHGVVAPQRTWVGLTQEELSEIYNRTEWDTVNGWEYERAIEAKLKEKNNG